MWMKLLIAVIVLIGCSFAASAQTSRGTVTGTVSDSAGAVIAGANITLTNTETNVSRMTVTNEEGIYSNSAQSSTTSSTTRSTRSRASAHSPRAAARPSPSPAQSSKTSSAPPPVSFSRGTRRPLTAAGE
ncbi:MAG: carboxypeptidase regulatory-like domain-containing protein [Pyrinomonadaceae bacterium]|nr:carboxypeptidase regulatory-like domain-containing protein [Pyrinomonadaceae bacterium]